jgi:hypothetical protein
MAEEKPDEPINPRWLTTRLRLDHEQRKAEALVLQREVLGLVGDLAAGRARLERARANARAAATRKNGKARRGR